MNHETKKFSRFGDFRTGVPSADRNFVLMLQVLSYVVDEYRNRAGQFSIGSLGSHVDD